MILKKKIIALVPAKGNSKGIKYKNLKKINGKTLIWHTSKFIDSIKCIDHKILSSENDKILKIAKKLGFLVTKRNSALSKQYVSDFRIIKHMINFIKTNKLCADYVVYLQPTSPIRKKDFLIKALKEIIRKQLDGGWSISKMNIKYHPLKVLKLKENYIRLYNQDGLKIHARQQLDNVYIRNGNFYIFDTKKLMKSKTIFMKKIKGFITSFENVNIDSLEDLKKCQKILNKN